MMDNIYRWVANTARELQVQAPVLEVGSYNVNGSIRELFPTPYTGMDIRPGEYVDVVGDVMTHESPSRFNTIVCCETLEHLRLPWKAVERMGRWLEPGGYLIVTVPFMHPIHDFPSDYYRFSGEGLKVLFEEAGLTHVCSHSDAEASYELIRQDQNSATAFVGEGVFRTTYGVARR